MLTPIQKVYRATSVTIGLGLAAGLITFLFCQRHVPRFRRAAPELSIPAPVAISEGDHAAADGPAPTAPAADPPAPISDATPIPVLGRTMASTDRKAAKAAFDALTQMANQGADQKTGAQSAKLVEIVRAMAAEFPRFSPPAKESAVTFAVQVIGWHTENPPASWLTALDPSAKLLGLALQDRNQELVRGTLIRVRSFGPWVPKTKLTDDQVAALVRWKQEVFRPCVRLLHDPHPSIRAEAVTTVAGLPLASEAAKVLPLLKDPQAAVRGRVLAALAAREPILSSEAILPLLHDPDPEIIKEAEHVLSMRGLTPDQIELGRLVSHPDPQFRIGMVEKVLNTSGLDRRPWLLHLSRDPAPLVRVAAVEALARPDDPKLHQRIEQMAAQDKDPMVRQKAQECLDRIRGSAARSTSESVPPPNPEE